MDTNDNFYLTEKLKKDSGKIAWEDTKQVVLQNEYCRGDHNARWFVLYLSIRINM